MDSKQKKIKKKKKNRCRRGGGGAGGDRLGETEADEMKIPEEQSCVRLAQAFRLPYSTVNQLLWHPLEQQPYLKFNLPTSQISCNKACSE